MGDEKVFTVVEVPALTTPKDNKKEKMEKAGYRVPALLPSVEEVFKWAPFQLPVKWIKKQRQNKSMLLLSVQEVFEWELVAACCVAVTVAVTVAIVLANVPFPCSETSKILQCPDLTPKQEDEVVSFCAGFLWLTVPQAAAATVGLLLPRRRAGSRCSSSHSPSPLSPTTCMPGPSSSSSPQIREPSSTTSSLSGAPSSSSPVTWSASSPSSSEDRTMSNNKVYILSC